MGKDGANTGGVPESARKREDSPSMQAVHSAHEPLLRMLLRLGLDPRRALAPAPIPATAASPSTGDRRELPDRSVPHLPAWARPLLDAFDLEGPAAFEEDPGHWVAARDLRGRPLFLSRAAGRRQYARPVACSWRLDRGPDGEPVYANNRTGQQVFVRPRALSWALIRTRSGRQLWTNWRQPQHPQQRPAPPIRVPADGHEAPAELPEDLAAEARRRAGRVWFNTATQEVTFSDPREHGWRELAPSTTGAGRRLWFHAGTGAKTHREPVEAAWSIHMDPGSGRLFYHNPHLNTSQWQAPRELAWVDKPILHPDEL